jgi:hypothetical protein
LFLSTIPPCGDATPAPGSADLVVAALATSDAIPVFCLLEAGSVATSPLTPVACKAQNLRARDRGVQSASYVILVVCMHVR